MKRYALAGLFCLVVCGCMTIGPDYKRPALQSPAGWAELKADQQPIGDLDQTAWWKAFNDRLLERLISEAINNNLDIKQAQARIVQARAEAAQAGASLWPQVSAGGSVTRSDASQNAMGTTGAPVGSGTTSPHTNYKAGFDASWELDVFGGTRRSIEASQARLDASREDLNATLLTLLGDVAVNYISLRASQEQLDITRRNIGAQRESEEVTRERNKLGLTSYLDVAQAQAQRTTTESGIPILETAIKQTIHRLGILLGKDPSALSSQLSPAGPLPESAGLTAAGLPSDLLQRRPDLLRAERSLAAASADIGVATAELYPKFDLTLGLGLESIGMGNFFDSKNRYWSIAPGFSQLIFNAGKSRAAIAGKKAAYDEAAAGYTQLFNKALEEVENALAAYYGEQERRRILMDSVRANKEAVELASDRYKRGLTSFVDVLITQRSLYNAQSSLSQANANLLTDMVALYKALGGGWQTAAAQMAVAAASNPAE
jgi:multidrug efflux system outer membrane protein